VSNQTVLSLRRQNVNAALSRRASRTFAYDSSRNLYVSETAYAVPDDDTTNTAVFWDGGKITLYIRAVESMGRVPKITNPRGFIKIDEVVVKKLDGPPAMTFGKTWTCICGEEGVAITIENL
jgi:hypothetical protein